MTPSARLLCCILAWSGTRCRYLSARDPLVYVGAGTKPGSVVVRTSDWMEWVVPEGMVERVRA